MKPSKSRFIGIGILVAATLVAAAYQVFGHGLIVTTELHPTTSPELAAKGMAMAGGQNIDLSRLIVLSIMGIIGSVIAFLPNRFERPLG
jgi:hypothetical protein